MCADLIETMDNDPVANAIGLYIVNCHGINLVAVRSIKVTRLPGGQVSGIYVKFIPEPRLPVVTGSTALKKRLEGQFRAFVSKELDVPYDSIREVRVNHQFDNQLTDIAIKVA